MRSLFVLSLLFFGYASNSQIINFPDANFKWALRTTICADSNGDGIHDSDADFNNDDEIDIDEALKIVHLRIDNRQISNLEGIQHFRNLKALNCYKNKLTTLNGINFNNHPQLISIDCNSNNITHLNLENFPFLSFLDFSGNSIDNVKLINLPKLIRVFGNSTNIKKFIVKELPKLEEIYLNINSLSELDLNEIKNLKKLECTYSALKSLNLNGLKNLTTVLCHYNYLEEIILDGLDNLEYLSIYKNNLKSLDIRDLSKLKTLWCGFGKITSIYLENLPSLTAFNCFDNKLITLFMKTGSEIAANSKFYNNPELSYICVDEKNILKIKELAIANGQLNCEVNSYCSFTPGGTFSVFNGESKYDFKSDGCDEQDNNIPNLKFNITDNNISGTFISNTTGQFSIPLQIGTHTITPILENPDHFEVAPSSYTVTFPSTFDTITQNFCITTKGIYKQTKLTVLPLFPPARPGSDASYKIVWENTGNQIENGLLEFTFDENKLDFISSSTAADIVDNGTIKWNFSDLRPFEKREINVTLRVNRPTDTPAVNAGDKLYLNASIIDNIFTLENTVVGSYDPNDKTCLQGDRVKPDMVGEYVDYLIRFENTGNYAAENVVVKDIIDTKTFDVSSLQITDASHEVYTRIEGNKVEFIFQNIQLPFDDANNDGYIAFKIKTLPSLVLGDSLKNLADIYFDYNFPIRTNEAQTTVALPVFTNDITTDVNIYPNPVSDILYLDTNENWSKAEIYDISGRIMRSISLGRPSIDVSELESGAYFIRLKDGDRVGVVKFVKI